MQHKTNVKRINIARIAIEISSFLTLSFSGAAVILSNLETSEDFRDSRAGRVYSGPLLSLG